jgi:hypothetical protein
MNGNNSHPVAARTSSFEGRFRLVSALGRGGLRAVTVYKMETITYDAKQIKVRQLEEIGGCLSDTENFTDILYRDRAVRYFLSQERRTPLPPNANYSWPRDDEWVRRMERSKTSIKEISEKEALKWYVTMFMNDVKLRARFLDLIKRFAD